MIKSPFTDKNGVVLSEGDMVYYNGELKVVRFVPMLRQWGLKDNLGSNSFAFTSLSAIDASELEFVNHDEF